MNSLKIKQIAVSLCVMLSLFASSIAACVCHDSTNAESHCEPPPSHEAKAENHSHDAEDSHHASSNEHRHEAISTNEFSISISPEECCCVQPAPKVFAKSETVKIEKQTADHQPNAPPEVRLLASVEKAEPIDFAKPFYLSDSFYNLKSPRAPPRS